MVTYAGSAAQRHERMARASSLGLALLELVIEETDLRACVSKVVTCVCARVCIHIHAQITHAIRHRSHSFCLHACSVFATSV